MDHQLDDELKSMTKSELYQRLVNNPDMVEDVLHSYNIRTKAGPLGPDVAGMTYYSRRGYYCIVANWLLEFEEQQFVFLHELYHIICEAPKITYILRLDHTREELMADMVAEAAAGFGQ